jgi:hypothetical protein
LMILRDNIDIYLTRFRFGFSAWCTLSFIHFLSGFTRDVIDARF